MTFEVSRQRTCAEIVYDARLAAGLSQNRLAKLATIDPAYVMRTENGSAVPSRVVLLKLARALDLDVWTTDRLLFVSGHAPQHDWQALALDYAQRLAHIDRALIGMADPPAEMREPETERHSA